MLITNTFYFFVDNCVIHKTKVVREFLPQTIDQVCVIAHAAYAPNLKDVERVWGQLRYIAIDDYYFVDTEKLEQAIIKAFGIVTKRKENSIG